MRKKREPTGMMVDVLSPLCLELDGSEKYGEGYAKCEMTLGMIQFKAGKTYLLSSEGVGTAKSLEEGDYLEVDLRRVKEPDAFPASIMPKWIININQATLSQFLEDEDLVIVDYVDLADFIRTFGQRLETNFYIWKKKLEKEQWDIIHTTN